MFVFAAKWHDCRYLLKLNFVWSFISELQFLIFIWTLWYKIFTHQLIIQFSYLFSFNYSAHSSFRIVFLCLWYDFLWCVLILFFIYRFWFSKSFLTFLFLFFVFTFLTFVEAFLNPPGPIGLELTWNERVRSTLITLGIIFFNYKIFFYLQDLFLVKLDLSISFVIFSLISFIIAITAGLYIYNVFIVNIGGSSSVIKNSKSKNNIELESPSSRRKQVGGFQ